MGAEPCFFLYTYMAPLVFVVRIITDFHRLNTLNNRFRYDLTGTDPAGFIHYLYTATRLHNGIRKRAAW